MASSILDGLLGDFSGQATLDGVGHPASALTTGQKVLLAAVAVAAYGIAMAVFGVAGLPALPRESSLLLQDQPFYGVFVAGVVLVGLTLLARPVVGRVRGDAPLFCAAVGLLALPTHGGDFRNAVLDAGGRGVFVRMLVELGLLAACVAVAYVALGVGRRPPELNPDDPANLPPAHPHPPTDTPADRATAVLMQTFVVLALLSVIGQSPLKGQALCGLALAGGLGAWVTFKARQVEGSSWSVAGTLLAGVIAYGWSYLHPDGIEIGDVRHALAGAAYSLPLHYATAGVAGTIYGYWAGRAGG